MAKTKLEKIASIEEEIKQLNMRKSQLKQQHNAQRVILVYPPHVLSSFANFNYIKIVSFDF